MQTTRPLMALLGFLLSAAVPAPGFPEATGSLAGTVLEDNNRPLVDVVVSYTRVSKLYPDALGRVSAAEPPFSGSVRSGPDGRFQATGLRPGDYYLCATSARINHLRSCDWGQGSGPVAVVAASTSPNIVLNVRTGSLIHIRIQDPTGRIQARDPTGITAGQTNMALGVISDRGFYAPARLLTTDQTELHFTVAVPKDLSVRLLLSGPVDIVDEGGQQLQRGSPSLRVDTADRADINVNLAVR